MKKLAMILAVVGLILACSGPVLGDWDAYVIRKSSGDNVSGNAPAINDKSGGAKEFVISEGGMKAAWGTNDINALTVGDITRLAIERSDDRTRFTAGSGPYVAPYFNIWVYNGNASDPKYAVIANEPSDGAFQPLYSNGYDLSWSDIADKVVKVYENSDKTWLPNGGVGLTFSDVVALQIGVPTDPNASWAGLGTGAPRKLNLGYDGTNDQYLAVYGFNWVFGDTLTSYVSGDPGYTCANPAAVPEPATMCLLGLGGLGVLIRRKWNV